MSGGSVAFGLPSGYPGVIACGLIVAEILPPGRRQSHLREPVLPILKARCFKCHAGAEPEHGLRLTSRTEILKGGSSGPAIRIAAAESSLLWEKLAGNAMPKGGPPLTAEEKGIVRSWINDGAASEESGASSESQEPSTSPASEHWSCARSYAGRRRPFLIVWVRGGLQHGGSIHR
jgi:hypothetical protein